jgi:hypothetical protein
MPLAQIALVVRKNASAASSTGARTGLRIARQASLQIALEVRNVSSANSTAWSLDGSPQHAARTRVKTNIHSIKSKIRAGPPFQVAVEYGHASTVGNLSNPLRMYLYFPSASINIRQIGIISREVGSNCGLFPNKAILTVPN